MRAAMAFLAAATLLTVGDPGASAAHDTANSRAADRPIFYLEATGGYNLVHDQDLVNDRFLFDVVTVAEARYDPGYVLGGAIGMRLGRIVRMEIEGAYSQNDFDEIDWSDPFFKTGNFKTSGRISVLSVMFNTFADIPTGTRFTPFVGAGIGLLRVKLDDVADADGPLFDDELNGIGLQFGTGLGFAVTDALTLSLQYRFLAGWLLETIEPKQPALAGDDLGFGYAASSFRLGLRYHF